MADTLVSPDGVVGLRSPRWAFWKRMTIPCQHGLVYLARLRIIQTPWFGIYLHDIYEPDGDRDPHNHPWSFISIVLRGSYHEKVYPNPTESLARWNRKVHGRFSIHKMNREAAHRIVYAQEGLRTLIFVGPRRSDWGFFRNEGKFIKFIPWQRYVEERG